MNSFKLLIVIAVSGVAFAFFSLSSSAQEVTGEPGAPGATTTLDGGDCRQSGPRERLAR